MTLTAALRAVVAHRRDATTTRLPELDDIEVYREVFDDGISVAEINTWEAAGAMTPEVADAYRVVIAAGWHPCHAALADMPQPLRVMFT
jgi:hypothetical protein